VVAAARLPRPGGAHRLGLSLVAHEHLRAHQSGVVESTGVLSKRVADSSLEKLTDVVLKQSIVGRMLDYGDIEVLTAAAGAGINYLRQIRKPMQFKTAMVNAKEELEHEMGQSR
jgi:uncharacterized membrane protein YdbT with pleckstrin-like domain